MKFYIDTDQCEKLEIPVDTALYLASLYYGKEINKHNFSESCVRGFMEYSAIDRKGNPVNPTLTQKGVDIVETIFLNSEYRKPNSSEDRYDILAAKLRDIYPTGKKPGTSYMWKDSVSVIAKKLKTLVKKYNCNFTDDQAVEATKNYVSSFNGDYRYMQLLKYFILKKNNDREEETSQLLSYIENAGQENSLSNDWNVELV